MFGVRRKEDVTQATEKVFASLRGLYRGENPRVSVFLDLQCRDGQLVLTAGTGKDGRLCPLLRRGKGCPFCLGSAASSSWERQGEPPFRAESVTVPEAGAPCGVSVLNGLRREALDKLLQLRQKRPAVPFVEKPLRFEAHPLRKGPLPLRAQFRSWEQVCPQAKACREIVLPLETPGGSADPTEGGRVSVRFIGHSQGAFRGGKSDSPKNGTVHGRGL